MQPLILNFKKGLGQIFADFSQQRRRQKEEERINGTAMAERKCGDDVDVLQGEDGKNKEAE